MSEAVFNPGGVPQELQEQEQWLLWDASAETPRRPHWNGDFQVSWNDPDEWHSFDEAVETAHQRESWGIGYVCAIDNPDHARGLYGVIDIDGALDADGNLKDWVPPLDRFLDAGTYLEYSPSGKGIHIPVVGQPKPDWFNDVQVPDGDHEGLDYLTHKFCTFTGSKLDVAGSSVAEVDPKPWLIEAYQNITGELPRDESAVDESRSDYGDDEWLTDDDVREALGAIDPDVGHAMWLRLGFAVHDYDSGSRGRQLFEEWSKGGSKWDTNAQRQVKGIWNNAKPGSGVTAATLVHHAKENGWRPPKRQSAIANGGAAAVSTAETPQQPSDPPELKPGAVIGRAGYDPEEHDLSDLASHEAAFAIDRILQDHDDWYFLVINDDSEDIYTFHEADGIWRRDGERRLKTICRQALGTANKTRTHNEVVYQVQGNPNYTIERDELGAPNGKIVTPDGMLNLLTRDIGPVRPRHLALNKIQASYDEDAEYEDSRWQQFLEDSVDPHDLDKLQEYAGYCLWHHAQRFGKALFLVGPTNSGKGTFLKTITRVIGDENVAGETLKDLITSRWGAAQLFGNMVNIRNEVSPGDLKRVEKFKELTGGEDTLSAEYKHRDKFKFRVTQKFMFATNQMPDVENIDGAFLNRCLFVSFPNTVADEDQDKDLLETLGDEREAILRWMLDGLDRLMRNGVFTNERAPEDKELMLEEHGDSVDRFVHSVLEVTGDTDDLVSKKELYTLYTRFCDWAGREPEVQQTFTTELKSRDGISDGQTRRLTPGDSRDDVYKGLRVGERACHELGHDLPTHSYEGDDGGGGKQDRFD